MAGHGDGFLADYNGDALKITAILFLTLTGLSVALRTYVRAFMTNSFQVDDWLMLIAQVNFIISCIFILIGVEGYGLGHHNAALPEWEKVESLKWQALATASYIADMMFIKLSIGVFLVRLAVQKKYKWIIYISMTVVLIWSIALFFWDVFQCNPVAAQWDLKIADATCVSPQDVVNAAYALSVLNILTDWLYALLPIPMIWNVKMTGQAKATVVAILGLGIFASIATLIRVKFLSDLTDTSDILFAGTNAMVWTLVEPGVAIIASSLVTIRPLLRQMRLKGFESSEKSNRSRGLWGTGGRAGLSGHNNNKNNNHNHNIVGVMGHNSKGQWSQVPSDNEIDGSGENMKLKDLEAGLGETGSKAGGGLGLEFLSSGGTTPTSITTTHNWDDTHRRHDEHTGGGNPVGVAVTTEGGDRTSTYFPAAGEEPPPSQSKFGNYHTATASETSSVENVLIIEGATTGAKKARRPGGDIRDMRTTTQAAKTITTRWRDERPLSVEESEGGQGLTYPGFVARRGNDARKTNRFSPSSRLSIEALPTQVDR